MRRAIAVLAVLVAAASTAPAGAAGDKVPDDSVVTSYDVEAAPPVATPPEGDDADGGGGAALPADDGAAGGGDIVGGTTTSITTRPFQVAFFPGSSLCGASIIHRSYLLTAAHCVDSLTGGSSVGARAGSSTYSSGGTIRSGLAGGGGDVDTVFWHGSWNPSAFENDLAIVVLSNPLPETSAISPVRVIEAGQTSLWGTGDNAVVSGWGTTSAGGTISSTLRQVTVPINAPSSCSSGSSYGSDFHQSTMLCVGPLGGGRDSCQGDSGGPLTVNGTGGPFEVGIVSWGYGCGFPNYPGIYTKLPTYETWLRQRVPLTDDFEDAYLLNGTGSESSATYYATRESGEPTIGGGTTGRSIWYRCVASGTGTYSVDTSGTSYDTVLGVYQGRAVDDLTTVGTDDDGGPGNTSMVTFSAVAGETYHIQLASFGLEQGFPTLNRTLPCHRETFSDVGRYSPFFPDIEWLSASGVTTGYPDGTFRPTLDIQRQAIAAYLYRLAGSPNGADPSCATAPFPDVPTTNTFCGEIEWLVDQGITTGYKDGTFKPTAAVQRQAMAAYLYRYAGEPLGAEPPCPAPPFADVPTSSPFCGEITWLAGTGITTGYKDGTFKPGAAIQRQAMAAYLFRYDHA